MKSPRMSESALKVLRFLLIADTKNVCGAMIVRETMVGPGTLSPLLARLESAGWLESCWQDVDPREARRRRLRFYRLTGVGQEHARARLTELQIPQVLS